MQRTRRKLWRDSTGHFRNRVGRKFHQLRAKGDRLNGPDALPLDCAAFLGGEALAGGFGFCKHLRQDAGVEIAHIQGRLAAADHRCHDSRERLDAAHGRYGIRMFHGYRPNLEGELCGSCESVMPDIHRRRSRVRFLTVEGDRMALDTLGSGDYG